jgi:hypothetical protein
MEVAPTAATQALVSPLSYVRTFICQGGAGTPDESLGPNWFPKNI